MYAVLSDLRKEGRQKGFDTLFYSGEYVGLCQQTDIPAGAVWAYALLTDTQRCLRFIAASLTQGYKY